MLRWDDTLYLRKLTFMLVMPTTLMTMQRTQAVATLNLQSLFSVYKRRGYIVGLLDSTLQQRRNTQLDCC